MNNSEHLDKKEGNNSEQSSYTSKILTWLKDFYSLHKKKILSVAVLMALFYMKKSFYDKFLPISDVMGYLSNRAFDKVVVGNIFMLCYFNSNTAGMKYCFANRALLTEQEISDALKQSQTTYTSPIISESVIGYGVMIGIYSYLCFKLIMNMKDMHGYKGKEKKDNSNQKITTFKDVGGCKKAIDALTEIIDYIKNPELFKNAGIRMPKGVLLYGPPGTGKTLIARAAASEAGIPVIYCSGSEFVEVFVGLGAKRVRDIFAQARKQSPCMIFIDEIDAVGFSRGNNNYIMGGGHREMETTLNELLNQMDGFEENDHILVVAATNLATTLDPALSRPGRFDHKIEVSLPNSEDRKQIFKIHLKNKSHAISEADLARAAEITEGLAGAEIENIVNLAALQSVRKASSMKLSQSTLESEDFIQYVSGFIKDKFQSARVSMNNQQPHHYYRQ